MKVVKKIKGQVYNRVSMAESESYMLVRYEDLVSDPQKRMGDVFGFLQVKSRFIHIGLDKFQIFPQTYMAHGSIYCV